MGTFESYVLDVWIWGDDCSGKVAAWSDLFPRPK